MPIKATGLLMKVMTATTARAMGPSTTQTTTKATPQSTMMMMTDRSGKKMATFRITVVFRVWTIEDKQVANSVGLLDFKKYETHHWSMVIGGIVAVVVLIAYALVFRKGAKYRHLLPSSGKQKPAYDKVRSFYQSFDTNCSLARRGFIR